jgi:homoserine dehydrogenase
VSAAGYEPSRSEIAHHAARVRRLTASGWRATRPRAVRLGLLGCGRVGQAVVALVGRARQPLRAAGFEVSCVRALVRDAGRTRPVPASLLTESGDVVLGAGPDVVVDVLGGIEPARSLVAAALRAGVPVVTANKSLVARHGPALRAEARRRGTTMACDAAVVAGVPFLGSIARRPLLARVRAIRGVINGTSHFVLTEVSRGASPEAALAGAVSRGYAEPDASADTSGLDAAEKLAILLHACGHEDVLVDDLVRTGIGGVEAGDFDGARLLSGTIKPAALAALQPGAAGSWVGPAFVDERHPLAAISGVTNAVELLPVEGDPVAFAGPGAGPDVTAAAILDDVIEVALGVRPARRIASRTAAPVLLSQPPPGSWFLRIAGADRVSARRAAEALAAEGVPPDRAIAHRNAVFVRSGRAPWSAIERARARLASPGACVLALPVIEP